MKQVKILIFMMFAFPLFVFAQSETKMFIQKTNGTDSVRLADIKNIYFKASTATATVVLADSFNSNINNWTGYGSPLPQWVASGFSRNGLFDNNGDPNNSSGGYSKTTISASSGMIIESDIYLDVTNQAGCWLGGSIGLTKTTNPTPSSNGIELGLVFSMDFSGDACWGDSVKYQRHKWFSPGLYAEDGSWDYPAWGRAPYLNADVYASTSWHRLKIDITPSGFVKFYCDQNLIWTSAKKIHPSLLSAKNVDLGNRSSGSAGKAYHDWVKLTTY